MNLNVFDLFAPMVTGLPPRAILKVLDLECKMLEEDAEHHRLTLPEDAFSVLCFRQFVRLAKLGQVMHCIRPFPPDHIEFYKKTVIRLIEAGELPPSAMEQFDYAFVPGVFS